MEQKNVQRLKSGESGFIRQLKIATLTEPSTEKYVHTPSLVKRTGTGCQIFESFT